MAGANRMHMPRRGSMQFWHRRRADKEIVTVRTWPVSQEPKLLGFVGFKAGMTHVMVRDNNPQSMTKGSVIQLPVTLIECPPMSIAGARLYAKTPAGLVLVSQIAGKDAGSVRLGQGKQSSWDVAFDVVRVIAICHPEKTGAGQKQLQLIEIGLGGNKEQQVDLAKQLLTKQIAIHEVFQSGQLVDIHGVTKGKGYQGTVKRFGVRIRQHKSEKTKRGIGTLGSWHPNRALYTVPQPGKMGYHRRTEFNKLVMHISQQPHEVNSKGGLMHYGLVQQQCLLLKGSVPGPVKRPIVLTAALRPTNIMSQYEIQKISTSSKQ